MNGIILRTAAIGTVKRGSYIRFFSKYETIKDPLGVKDKKVRTRLMQQMPACEAVVFECPAPKCRKRNVQSLLNGKKISEEILAFTCCKCEREIEVEKPSDKQPDIIVPGIQTPKPFSLVDAAGRNISR